MAKNYIKIITLTTVLVYTYFFSEWLFFITKPSFLTKLSFLEDLSVLLVTPLPILVACLIALAILQIPGIFFSRIKAGPIVPTLVLSVLIFLLLDNFTHTLFRIYVGSHESIFHRFGYLALFILIFILVFQRISIWLRSDFWGRKSTLVACLILPAISLSLSAAKNIENAFEANEIAPVRTGLNTNILILSTDGLDATNMSAYGYTRPTTPFIESIVSHSLLLENSFSNNTQTTGSIGALYSGKLPTRTGVIFPPDTFFGTDIFQHFAGYLKKHGYRNLDVGVPYYADSYDLNLRDAFDETALYTTNSDIASNNLPIHIRLKFASELFFLDVVLQRAESRLLHIFGIRDMVDPFTLVTSSDIVSFTDEDRLQKLFNFISNNVNRPFFAHVHLMDTHGPRFRLNSAYYSQDQFQDKDWMLDFYDDAILEFDVKAERIFGFLDQAELLENTIVVITSDHGSRMHDNGEEFGRAGVKIPLIFNFPGSSITGRIKTNTQTVDIPPTILDYLGLSRPEWMDGDSLISDELTEDRQVLITKTAAAIEGAYGKWRVEDYTPPFYSLGKLLVAQCQLLFSFDLSTGEVSHTTILTHTAPCSTDELLTESQAKKLMVQHLEEAGYDIGIFFK